MSSLQTLTNPTQLRLHTEVILYQSHSVETAFTCVLPVVPQVTCLPPIVTIHRRSQTTGQHSNGGYNDTEEVKVELKCSVKANPPTDSADLQWIVADRRNISLRVVPGETNGIFHASAVTVRYVMVRYVYLHSFTLYLVLNFSQLYFVLQDPKNVAHRDCRCVTGL
jgi:hypothetical protein